ncbi:MAG: tRNA pseudouridine(55) synthase TruB [Bacteroidales bacterium]|jgi:tRNA pseudouridine55 synthase|nr:tRNA pseudouridine(55) synthase TruB [Bacteroidales bacterium]
MLSEKPSIFEQGQVLLFDKPLYWTSFDLVNKVRNILRNSLGLKKIKVGHAGTLDPLASGLMIICTGKATRTIENYRNLDKEYTATLTTGATTPSFDLETEVDAHFSAGHITEELIREKLQSFLGEQKQLPPLYSAKLVAGKRAYEYARKGINVELQPATIYFRELELLSFRPPEITVRIVCSKGAYIRSFARDLGKALGSGCYLSALERNSIGTLRLGNAYSIGSFAEYVEQTRQNEPTGTPAF